MIDQVRGKAFAEIRCYSLFRQVDCLFGQKDSLFGPEQEVEHKALKLERKFDAGGRQMGRNRRKSLLNSLLPGNSRVWAPVAANGTTR